MSMLRRDFIKTTAAATALTAAHIPSVHAAGGDTVQVALIGCGGRGTGAAADALSAKGGVSSDRRNTSTISTGSGTSSSEPYARSPSTSVSFGLIGMTL